MRVSVRIEMKKYQCPLISLTRRTILDFLFLHTICLACIRHLLKTGGNTGTFQKTLTGTVSSASSLLMEKVLTH